MKKRAEMHPVERGLVSLFSGVNEVLFKGIESVTIEASITDSSNTPICQKIVFNTPVNDRIKELVEFPVKVRDLPNDSYLVLTFLKSVPMHFSAVSTGEHDVFVVGGTSVRLFGENVKLVTGEISLRIMPGQTGHSMNTPGDLECVKEESMDDLALIHRANQRISRSVLYRRSSPQLGWVAKKYWDSVEEVLKEKGKEGRNILIRLTMPKLPKNLEGVPILFTSFGDKTNPSEFIRDEENEEPRTSSGYGLEYLTTSFIVLKSHLTSTMSTTNTTESEENTNTSTQSTGNYSVYRFDYFDQSLESTCFDGNFPNLPKINERNPTREKFLCLSRGKFLLERARKRKPETEEVRRKLLGGRLLEKTCVEELTLEEKKLIWDHRYFLMKSRPESLVKIIFSATTKISRRLRDEVEEEEDRMEGKELSSRAREMRQKLMMFRIDRKKRNELFFDLLPRWNTNNLGIVDALELLSYRYENEPVIREFAVLLLEKMTDEELFSILLQLVQSLHYETSHYKFKKTPLGRLLMSRAAKNYEIASYLYWHLNVEVENYSSKETHSDQSLRFQFSKLQYSLLRSLSEEHVDSLDRQVRCFKLIKRYVNKMKMRGTSVEEMNSGAHKELETSLTDGKIFPFPSHIDPKIMITGLQAKKCKFFRSKTKPLCLAFRTLESDETYRMFFKVGDDLRQDQVILQTIRFMDSMLKNNHLNLNVTPYRALPCELESGFLEFVTNCIPVEEITQSKPKEGKPVITNSILPFLASKRWCTGTELWDEKNSPNPQQKEYRKMKERFRKSCAAYCVVSYVLGFGDRHLDNILVIRDGRMVHIDFGFILGRTPWKKSFFAPAIKLTKGMREAIGIKKFGNFLEEAAQAYSIFRGNARLLVSIFVMMMDSKIEHIVHPSERFDENYLFCAILKIIENLKVREIRDRKKADLFIAQQIRNNYDTWGGMIEDVFHTWAKKRK